MNNSVCLSTAYLAPIQYYTKLISYDKVFIERFEHYSKQSYRNRCQIITSNGILALTIPVKKGENLKVYTKDVEIDYHTRWQSIHLRAIESAYRNSPFYIYFIDDLIPTFESKPRFLFDFNMQLQETILKLIGEKLSFLSTDEYIANTDNADDFRQSIHPKARENKEDPAFNNIEYYQVFSSKFGFIPNLSIVDLLFNMGNSTIDILRKSSVEKPWQTH